MSPSAPAGFSLVELTVSLGLGLATLLAVGQVFQAASRSYSENSGSSMTQDNLRFGMAHLTRDVEMAGYFADIVDPGADILVAPETRTAYRSGCPPEWLFDDLGPLDTIGNVTDARVKEAFPCLRDVRAGTDVLATRRVLGQCDPAPAVNRFHLTISGVRAALVFGDGSTPAGPRCGTAPESGDRSYFQYVPAIWHIAKDHGVPSLCREILSGSRMVRNCVSPGIEDLQLEFGVDGTGGRGDGAADYFTSFDSPPDARLLGQVVAVRVHLLGRSVDRPRGLAAHPVAHRYQLGNVIYQPGPDGYHRRTLSALVILRNPARRANPASLPIAPS